MKKVIALIVAVMMLAVLFVACAPAESPVPDEPSESPAAAPATEAPAATDAPAATEAPAATAAAADGSLERVQKQGFFIVGLDDAFPPMGYRDANDEIVGFDIDFARAVAKKMGVEVKFQPVVWDNIAQEVKSRNVDIIWNGCTITDERKQVFDFSKPYMLNKQVVVVLKDSSYQKLADLAGKTAGIQDGSSANIALDAHPEFKSTLKEVIGFAANDKALLDLAAKRIDCVVVDAVVYAEYFKLKPDTYRLLDEDLGKEEYGIAFNQEDDTFRDAMQAAIDACMSDGTADEIANKWFGSTTVLAK